MGAEGGRGGAGPASIELLNQLTKWHQLAQVNPAQQRHFQVVSRVHRAAYVELRLRQHVEGAHQILAGEPRGKSDDALALPIGSYLGIGGA